MPQSETNDAATSSCVERGLEAISTDSAPPACRARTRFAVSVVTCAQATMRTPLKGFSRSAHSMRRLPWGAKSIFFTSYSTGRVAVIYISLFNLFYEETQAVQ